MSRKRNGGHRRWRPSVQDISPSTTGGSPEDLDPSELFRALPPLRIFPERTEEVRVICRQDPLIMDVARRIAATYPYTAEDISYWIWQVLMSGRSCLVYQPDSDPPDYRQFRLGTSPGGAPVPPRGPI